MYNTAACTLFYVHADIREWPLYGTLANEESVCGFFSHRLVHILRYLLPKGSFAIEDNDIT